MEHFVKYLNENQWSITSPVHLKSTASAQSFSQIIVSPYRGSSQSHKQMDIL